MRKQLTVGSRQLAASRKNSSSLLAVKRQLPTSFSRGFTLIELVVTLMILAILTMGAIPLIKVSVRRQREQQLREALHEMREAIDQFHREALAGAQIQQPGQQAQVQPGQPGQVQPGQQPGQGVTVDPRVRVGITDNTIFGTDNVDRYPPDLETMVNGVSVTPLALPGNGGGGGGIAGLDNERGATSNTLSSTKKKVYLREIPIDPMTGERDWNLRSVFDSKDSASWGGENVFDVRSKSNGTALNGEKYSDW
jgi:general secretion pathway protein G